MANLSRNKARQIYLTDIIIGPKWKKLTLKK